MENVLATKQGKALLNRLARREAVKKLARERARDRLTPAEFEADRQKRKAERQTNAAALVAAEARAKAAVDEVAAIRKAAEAAAARAEMEVNAAKARADESARKEKQANAAYKVMEGKHSAALTSLANMQETAKALEEKLNRATAENGRLVAAIRDADTAAQTVMQQNASLQAKATELEAQLETARKQYEAAATELEALKRKE